MVKIDKKGRKGSDLTGKRSRREHLGAGAWGNWAFRMASTQWCLRVMYGNTLSQIGHHRADRSGFPTTLSAIKDTVPAKAWSR